MKTPAQTRPLSRDQSQLLWVWTLSFLLVAASFMLQAHIGLDLSDDGYLTHGAWRVGQGEVPRLDFRSYDPPRNYWIAFWSLLFGYGPLGMRAGVAVFQALGLACGLLAARRAISNTWILSLAAGLLMVWMWPRHKVFEPSIIMIGVYVAVLFLEKPTLRRVLLCGTMVGLAASLRRNHGLYMFLSFAVMIGWEYWRPPRLRTIIDTVSRYLGGIVVGFSPIWILALIYTGFGTAYLESVLVLLERGQTNQPLPVPWPWTVELTGLDWTMSAHQLAVGCGFLALFLFYPIAVIQLWRTRGHWSSHTTLLAGALLVGAPYVHHAMVRSDLSHLAQVAHPALLGTIAMLAMGAQRGHKLLVGVVSLGLVLLAVLVPLPRQPGINRLLYPRRYINQEILGDHMWVQPWQASLIATVQSLPSREGAPSDTLVFLAPLFPGLYQIIDQRSPVWDPYPIWPVAPDIELQMVEDLRDPRVRWAVIGQGIRGGTSFDESHRRVWSFIQSEFEATEESAFPARFTVLRRRASAESPTRSAGRGRAS